MKIATKPQIITLGIIVAIVSYFMIMYPSYTYRYRMTVEINTPEGVKYGSSVIEVTTTQWPEWLAGLSGGHSQGSRAYGEAPFVDLGERGILFAALKYNFTTRIYPTLFTGKTYGAWPHGGVPDYAKARNFEVELGEGNFPKLVYFEDLKDPISVKEAPPQKLSEVFGEGVSLKAIRIEATEDKLEKKVDKVISWLPQYRGKLLDGRKIHTIKAENKLANNLGPGSFSFHKKK